MTNKLPFPPGSVNRQVTDIWRTVSMIPAPVGMFGRSSIREEDGTTGIYEAPAACLLLQERIELHLSWQLPDGDTVYFRSEECSVPCWTRIVPGFVQEDTRTIEEDEDMEIVYRVRDQ